MLTETIAAIFQRELESLRRQLEAYPDDRTVWRTAPGITNSAGTLVLHLAGNLQHYLGAVLGGTGYVRDRNAEFARRDAARAELLQELDHAADAVRAAFERLNDDDLAVEYPEEMAGRRFLTGGALVHIAAHFAYHRGQVNYHRRLLASTHPGESESAGVSDGTSTDERT